VGGQGTIAQYSRFFTVTLFSCLFRFSRDLQIHGNRFTIIQY
jgi:hypothetical protein